MSEERKVFIAFPGPMREMSNLDEATAVYLLQTSAALDGSEIVLWSDGPRTWVRVHDEHIDLVDECGRSYWCWPRNAECFCGKRAIIWLGKESLCLKHWQGYKAMLDRAGNEETGKVQ